jgi:REP element-mobilizing transposase RayT
MPGTFSQINIHAVFAVRFREAMIAASWREDLFRYISGILRDTVDYPLAVGGWKDHVHIFYEQKPAQSTSDVLRVVKANSSKWINEIGVLRSRFAWQEGYGAFSYSRSQRSEVVGYIMNQEDHHRGKTFREEYLGLLDLFGIPFDARYLFEFFE